MPTTPTYLPTTRVSWDDSKIYATPGVDAVYFCNGAHHECCNGNDVVPIKVSVCTIARSAGGPVSAVFNDETAIYLALNSFKFIPLLKFFFFGIYYFFDYIHTYIELFSTIQPHYA